MFLGRKCLSGGNRIGTANFFGVRPFQQLVCRVDLSLRNGFLKLFREITDFHLSNHDPRNDGTHNKDGGTAGKNNAPMNCGAPGNLGLEQGGALAKAGRSFVWNWPGEICQQVPNLVHRLIIIPEFWQFYIPCRGVLFLALMNLMIQFSEQGLKLTLFFILFLFTARPRFKSGEFCQRDGGQL